MKVAATPTPPWLAALRSRAGQSGKRVRVTKKVPELLSPDYLCDALTWMFPNKGMQLVITRARTFHSRITESQSHMASFRTILDVLRVTKDLIGRPVAQHLLEVHSHNTTARQIGILEAATRALPRVSRAACVVCERLVHERDYTLKHKPRIVASGIWSALFDPAAPWDPTMDCHDWVKQGMLLIKTLRLIATHDDALMAAHVADSIRGIVDALEHVLRHNGM